MKVLLIMLIMFSLSFGALDVKTYIPKLAYIYYPVVLKESDRLFPEFILPSYFGSLIEHESCINLKSSRCWSPKSSFKTKREEGAGLGMLTRAYHRNGKLRFDKLSEMRVRHDIELKHLNWKSVYTRPDLQIKAIILLWSREFRRYNSTIDYWDRIAFADSAYNGGYGGIMKRRRRCARESNCDQNKWFGNVEKSCRSKKKLYGNRTKCDINNHHVTDILTNRLNKYLILERDLKIKDKGL